MRLLDLTGGRSGALTVLGRAGNDGNGKVTWSCQCDCGERVVVEGTLLRRGTATFCRRCRPCALCGRVMQSLPDGQPRRFCSGQCKDRSRYRRPCAVCGRPFRFHRGGTEQRYCGADCKRMAQNRAWLAARGKLEV